jgi:toxin CcdB
VPQFAVYENKKLWNSTLFPFVVDVQPDMFQELDTCLVIPLSNAIALKRFPLLFMTPEVVLDDAGYLLVTPQLAGVARADLGPYVGSIAAQERTILSALDFLIRGYC